MRSFYSRVAEQSNRPATNPTASPVRTTVMKHRWLLLATIALPSIGACSDTSSATPTSTATTGVAVGVADFKFTSADVQVPVGGSVKWTNNDSQPHTATSAGVFDAGTIEPGKSVTVAFPAAGSFTYICSFHPFMTGTVTVG